MLRARLWGGVGFRVGCPGRGVGEPCEGCFRGPTTPFTGAVAGRSAGSTIFSISNRPWSSFPYLYNPNSSKSPCSQSVFVIVLFARSQL